jgi:hypothetical protein
MLALAKRDPGTRALCGRLTLPPVDRPWLAAETLAIVTVVAENLCTDLLAVIGPDLLGYAAAANSSAGVWVKPVSWRGESLGSE